MNTDLIVLCESFIEDREKLKKVPFMETTKALAPCALFFISRGVRADEEKLRACKALIKERAGLFSSFRGLSMSYITCRMSLEADPENWFTQLQTARDTLRSVFRMADGDHLVLSAQVMLELVDPSRFAECASRVRALFDQVRKKHPIMTDSQDIALMTLLCTGNRPVEAIAEEIERCQQELDPLFPYKNMNQSLAFVLALNELDAGEKCRRTYELYDTLYRRGRKWNREYALSVLGTIAMQSIPVQDILQADSFLSRQRCYGFFGITKSNRLMHAGILAAADQHQNDNAMEKALLTGSLSAQIAAQQCMMICCAAAASATAATAASSSH